MDETTEYDESGDLDEVIDESDLLIGFAWHDEERHWDFSSMSFPETFSEAQVERLQALAEEFAQRLTGEGFDLPEGYFEQA